MYCVLENTHIFCPWYLSAKHEDEITSMNNKYFAIINKDTNLTIKHQSGTFSMLLKQGLKEYRIYQVQYQVFSAEPDSSE